MANMTNDLIAIRLPSICELPARPVANNVPIARRQLRTGCKIVITESAATRSGRGHNIAEEAGVLRKCVAISGLLARHAAGHGVVNGELSKHDAHGGGVDDWADSLAAVGLVDDCVER